MLTALFYGVMTILVLPKFPITVITGKSSYAFYMFRYFKGEAMNYCWRFKMPDGWTVLHFIVIVSVHHCLSLLGMLEFKMNEFMFCFIWFILTCNFCGIGPEFRQRGFFGRMFYILLFAALQRQKYYFAWKLGIYYWLYYSDHVSVLNLYLK